MVGSMLYATGGKLRLQLFRADVQDHRDAIPARAPLSVWMESP
jgi:hypothetical protein